MKLSELKRIAEEHGCRLREEDDLTFVKYGSNIIATVDNRLCCVLDTVIGMFNVQYDEIKPVIAAVVEYAMTPIEDRKEDELFYVRYPIISALVNTDDMIYVNYDNEDEVYCLESKPCSAFYKTQFTTKEIETMPESFQQAIRKGVLEVIEVSEVDG